MMIRRDFSVADYQSFNAGSTMFEWIKGAYRGCRIWLEDNGCRHKSAGILENLED